MTRLVRGIILIVVVAAALLPSAAQQIVAPSPVCPNQSSSWLELPTPLQGGAPYEVEIGLQRVFYPDAFAALYGLQVFGVDRNVSVKLNYEIEYIGGLKNPPDEPITVHYFALINETILPLGLNGELLLIELIPWRQVFSLTIELPPLQEEGLYDVVLIGIPNLDSPTSPYEFERLLDFFSARMTLIVGDPSIVGKDPRAYQRMLPAEPHPNDPPLLDGALRTPVWFDLFTGYYKPFFDPFGAGERLSFNIELGQTRYFVDDRFSSFSNLDLTRYALLVMVDDRLKPLSEEGEEVLLAEMPGNAALVEHPIQVQVPSSGVMDIVAIRIDFPGVPLCVHLDPVAARIHGLRMGIQASE